MNPTDSRCILLDTTTYKYANPNRFRIYVGFQILMYAEFTPQIDLLNV